ncbi:WecB/TagA/CpsF family glycosyltransferase [Qipengyuania sphaerica]|uniref:WecB/TagA/CpsF family glycosyltransferase n=1 Tax=Qipengyuania sphaerica TaxID=2867243 RepID=UPI001C8889FC|nr:WecB/TagA/CpsF family glycosyltransferase [Qipengyuania sphaerica]MBX7539395.1 WecB/TagA/CpsF family glycosyltransferase [Qipengyuania sphaerica]
MEGIEDKFDQRSAIQDRLDDDDLLPLEAKKLFFEKPPGSADELYIDPLGGKEPEAPELLRTEFLGMNFHNAVLAELLDSLSSNIGAARFRYAVTPNVDHLVTIARSAIGSDIRVAYDEADYLVCDSRVLSLMARKSRVELPAVPGSDITAALLARLEDGTSIAAVGGSPVVHEELRARYPQFEWSFFIPPMGVLHSEEAQDAICQFVATTDADISFIAIGAPQSEVVCRKIKAAGNARGLALCIGASLEFITGEKTRAPLWVQKAHCEWLFRLLQEPHRLAYRYLIKGPTIFLAWARWSRSRRGVA